MSAAPASRAAGVEAASSLPPEPRSALRELLLTLADSKRLLGMRYSDWMLGTPSLETGIAAASMAQDEWGHARLTYALLPDFGDDATQLEHLREAGEYCSLEVLDVGLASWPELIAAALTVDTALTLQYGALVESHYLPVRNRVQKLLEEERLHLEYAAGWTRRLADSPVRSTLAAALGRFLTAASRWLGDPGADGARALKDAGITREGPGALRERLLGCVGAVLEEVGLAEEVGLVREGGGWGLRVPPGWEGWDERRRRGAGGGPDASTLERVRGDKNRAVLID